MGRFCRQVQETPAGQCVALLEQVTNSIKSVFLAKLGPRANDSSEVVGEARPRNRRKRRSHENGTVVATSGEEFVSSSFASALLRGVDVLSLVLINSPLSVWTGGGLHREKAREALLAVQRDVHRPLVVAAEEMVSGCKEFLLEEVVNAVLVTGILAKLLTQLQIQDNSHLSSLLTLLPSCLYICLSV